MKRAAIILIVFYVFDAISCFGLDTATHQYINNRISQSTNNKFSLNSYLNNQLGIQKGVDEVLTSIISGKSLKVSEWLRDGGLYEDKPPWTLPYVRSANHFHDPITDKGFTGLPPGDSAIVWSQKPVGQQWVGGNYSWPDSRDNFYAALTATNKTKRDGRLAETFRGVGQLMHLMQDMSVPEHARNDFHALPAYEEWLKETVALPLIKTAFGNPIYPDSSLLLQPSQFSNAPVPIANLFDTNQYNGSSAASTTGSTFGLSEYTNANFFSPDTIFASNYPFPRWTSVQEWDDTINGKKRTYLRKVSDGEQIEHAATGRWFYKYLPDSKKSSALKLDEVVYVDYAKLLLPKAVGYSAALLDYFFRGKLTINATPTDITFSSIKVTAANSTPNETMGAGVVSLVIRYKPLAETGSGLVKTLANPSADYSYKVATLTNVDMTNAQTLTFDFSTDALPMSYSDMTMQLVFKGKLYSGPHISDNSLRWWPALKRSRS